MAALILPLLGPLQAKGFGALRLLRALERAASAALVFLIRPIEYTAGATRIERCRRTLTLSAAVFISWEPSMAIESFAYAIRIRSKALPAQLNRIANRRPS